MAAAELKAGINSSLAATGAYSNLLTELQRSATHVGIADVDSVVANAIGFLSQTYDACAGLIGNTFAGSK